MNVLIALRSDLLRLVTNELWVRIRLNSQRLVFFVIAVDDGLRRLHTGRTTAWLIARPCHPGARLVFIVSAQTADTTSPRCLVVLRAIISVARPSRPCLLNQTIPIPSSSIILDAPRARSYLEPLSWMTFEKFDASPGRADESWK